MNASVTLDFLISNGSGDTLFYDERCCPTSLIKEAILRGFQIISLSNLKERFIDRDECWGVGNEFGDCDGDGYGSGKANGNGNLWVVKTPISSNSSKNVGHMENFQIFSVGYSYRWSGGESEGSACVIRNPREITPWIAKSPKDPLERGMISSPLYYIGTYG